MWRKQAAWTGWLTVSVWLAMLSLFADIQQWTSYFLVDLSDEKSNRTVKWFRWPVNIKASYILCFLSVKVSDSVWNFVSQHNKNHSMVIVGVCSRKSIKFPEDLLIYLLTNLWKDLVGYTIIKRQTICQYVTLLILLFMSQMFLPWDCVYNISCLDTK